MASSEGKYIRNDPDEMETVKPTDSTPFMLSLAAKKWKKEAKLSLEKHENIGESLEKSLFDSSNIVYFEGEEKLHEISSRDGQRKYFLVNDEWYTNENDQVKDVYKLLSEYRATKELSTPETCLSVSRSYDPIEQTVQKSTVQFLKYIFNQKTWIVTYGKDTSGYISDMLGRFFKENQKVFLLGLTDEIEIEESYKAISGRQYNLQPQHTTYINFQNERQSDHFRGKLEEEIVKHIGKNDKINSSNSNESINIKERVQVYKYVYLIVGGDDTTYGQLKNWFEIVSKDDSSRNVVMIVKNSGDVANLILDGLKIVEKARNVEDFKRMLKKYQDLYDFDSEEAFNMLLDIKKKQRFLEISEEKCCESNEIISKINALQECLDVDLSPNNLLYGIMDKQEDTADIFTMLKVIYNNLYKLICNEHLWKLYQNIFISDSSGISHLLCVFVDGKSSLKVPKSNSSLAIREDSSSNSDTSINKLNHSRVAYIVTELIGEDCYFTYRPETDVDFDREKKLELIQDVWDTRTFEYSRYTWKNELYTWDLLVYSILTKNKVLLNELLEDTNGVAACLFALILFKRLSDRAEILSEVGLQNELKENSEYYEKLAAEILKDLYNKHSKTAYGLLQTFMTIDRTRNKNLLDIAVSTEAKIFLSGSCVQTYSDLVWRAGMVYNWKYRLFILPGFILFSPIVLLLGLIKFSDLQKLDDNDDDDDHKDSTLKQCLNSNFLSFYRSPVVKYSINVTFYLFFLGLFTYFILLKLAPYWTMNADDMTLTELLIIIWVIGLFLDEVRQLFYIWLEYRPFSSGEKKGCFKTLMNVFAKYFRGVWEILDFVKILFFFTSEALRWQVEDDKFVVARIMFGITLILFFLRLLKFAYVFEALGPRILTIFMMVKDLVQFLFIAFIFLFSFGISYQAILGQWVNTDVSFYNVTTSVIAPQFWRIFGDLQLKTIDKDKETSDVLRWFLPAYVGIYMIAMNILLLNLLIAIFTNSFEKVRSESKQVWGSQKVSSTREYQETPFFPSPLNIPIILIEIPLRIFKICLFCCFGARKPKRSESSRKALLSRKELFLNDIKDSVLSSLPKNFNDDEKNTLDYLSDLSVDVAQMKKSLGTSSSVTKDDLNELKNEINDIKKLFNELKRSSILRNNNYSKDTQPSIKKDHPPKRESQEELIKKQNVKKIFSAPQYSDSRQSKAGETFYRRLSDVQVDAKKENEKKDDGTVIEIDSQWL